MTMSAMMILIFVSVLALSAVAIYLLVAQPLRKKRTLARLESIQNVAVEHTVDLNERILREDVLSDNPSVNRFLRQFPLMVRLHLFVKQSALGTSVGRLLAYSLIPALFVLLISLLLAEPMISLILASGVGAIPFMVVGYFRKKRFGRFEELFPEAIDLLARAVRAGHAFTSGLEMIADEVSEPLSGEFRRVFEQQNLGMPIRDALLNLVLRVPLPDVRIFVTALIIQREAGGNLAEILDNLSHVVRERFKLIRNIQVVTAQGRLTRNILLAVPPAMGLFLYAKNPDYMRLLWTDPFGKIMLYAAIVSQVIGFFLIQKIIQPKV